MIDELRALARLHELALLQAERCDDVLPLLGQVLDLAIELSEADFGNLQLLDPDTHDLRIAVQRGFPRWWVEFWDRQARGQGACGSALEARQRIVVADVAASPLFAGTPTLDAQLGADVRAVQSTPLVTRAGQAVGVVSTHFRQPRGLHEAAGRWLDLLARQAADLIDGARSAAALRRSEARLQALVTASWDVTYTVDALWTQARPLGGSCRSALALAQVPAPCADWLQRFVAPADHARVRAAVQQAIRDQAAFDIEHGVVLADAGTGWWHSRAVPVRGSDGTVLEWFGASRDVTAAQRSAARFAAERHRLDALLQALPVGVAFTDSPDCAQVSANQALRALLSVDGQTNISASADAPDAFGRQLVYRLAGRPLAAGELPLQRAAREGRRVGPLELELALPDGRGLLLEVTAAPVAGSHGAVAVLVDVGERRRAAETREEIRRKDEFLSVLSHELRNPLAAIATAVDGLQARRPGGDGATMQTVVQHQVDVMSRLVDDLADVARIANGQLGLRREPVSLQELMHAAATALRPAIADRAQALVLRLPAPDVCFEGDPVRLLQIAMNLLDNAARYGRAGGIVELQGGLEDGDVVLRCRDDGRGIEPELLERIFEPLFRAPAARQAAPQGLGLGLTLIRRLAELHGGSAAAHSEGRDRGSEFVVRIPFVAAAAGAAPATSGPEADAAPSRVLLVEDHAELALVTLALLRAEGLQARSAATGRGAIEAALQMQPQLLLCDLSLPDMSGLQLIDQLRPQLRAWHTRVVVLTALTRAELEVYGRRAAELGVDRFIAKPLTVEQLRAALRPD